MRTLTSSQRRWLIIGLGIVSLIVVTFVFRESAWHALQQMTAKTSSTTERSGQLKATPPSSKTGPGQAYAMVTPLERQLIGVKTGVVETHPLQTVIRAVGRIEYDEQRLVHVNLRLSGWIDDLFVDYTGQSVRKGQPLFTLYSQELVTAQEEYLLALHAEMQIQESPLVDVREQAELLLESARDRLRLWTLTEAQIRELARRGKPQTYVTIYSPASGYVVEKKAFQGMFVKPEMTLYTIADLSTVWAQAEIFEYEVPFVRVGQPATLTLDAYPGEGFHGEIAYIYPYLNKQARTVKVRLEFPNPTMRLKPDMYGTVRLEVDHGETLAVPEEAVIDSGIRTVVFVARGEGLFEPREVTLGPKMGRYYEVVEGLAQGEHIVTSGTFLLDSESKLMTSTSMMGALGMGGIKMEQAHMGEM